MQNRYAGDVGDFGKLALLRALGAGRRLGIAWYLTDGGGEANNDGKHLTYLEDTKRFRYRDEHLFDALGGFVRDFRVRRAERSVAALERLGVLPADTLFHGEHCPKAMGERSAWAERMVAAMRGAALVFVDPDNGLETTKPSNKCVLLNELAKLRAPARAFVVYHHATRRPGGANAEFKHQVARLEELGFSNVSAALLRPYSPRFYFVLDGDEELKAKLDGFVSTWGDDAELFS